MACKSGWERQITLPDEWRLAAAFAVALSFTWLAVPLAIRVADRTRFHDVPRGYKGHQQATPYLGGAALMAGFVPAALLFGAGLGGLGAIIACALVLFVVGTIDDRRTVSPLLRILAEIGAGVVLFSSDLGFSAFGSPAANLALTVVFVLGVVNAFNLIDNIDGAAATVAAVSACGLGILSAAGGDVALGALSLALAGACLGFLPRNLASPARIFLGDGGSMPIGLVIAAAIMNLPDTGDLDWAMLPVAAVLVGLPALDTSLVIVARLHRGARIHDGARDHLTHRLLGKLGSARRVALVLAGSQAALTVVGADLLQLRPAAALAGSVVVLLGGLVVIVALEWPKPGTVMETSV
jgi:UDP-GlcNAc:undecaprenyl-phosphate/decaprenyl-phosphate GlcNAc-1-phosphate transferase